MTEISRRKFIQLTVVSGAAVAAGCRIDKPSRYDTQLYKSEAPGQYGGYDNRVFPYLNQPEGLQDGVPQYFATVCQMCPAGCGLFVRTIGGRAVKVEGNPAHPVSAGKTCARGQTSLQHLYNPDRLRFPATRVSRTASPATTDWETALRQASEQLRMATGRVAILVDAVTIGRSPSLMRLVQSFAHNVGGTLTMYSLLEDSPWRAAAQAVYGHSQIPAYQLDQADYILSFGGDFLEAWPSPVYYNRLFGEFRQGPRRQQGDHGRFVYIGPRMSMTAAKADQWIPCNPGAEALVAQAISSLMMNKTPAVTTAQYAAETGLTEMQLQSLANGFSQAGSRAVAVPGSSLLASPNATAAFTAVEALNAQAQSRCVGFGQAAPALPAPNPGGAGYRPMQALVSAMQAGQVGALLIFGQPNPVFTLPGASGFTDALTKAPFVAALTPFEDETTAFADVLLPTRSFLEDWGDDIPAVLPPDVRMATLRQPIIDPQFIGGTSEDKHEHTPWMDTRPLGDLLIDLAQRQGKPLHAADTRAAVRQTWAGFGQADLAATTTENDVKWVAALSQGGYWAASPAGPAPAAPRLAAEGAIPAAPPVTTPGTFALYLYPHIYWTDGRHANLPWLQENPDPMTMAVWNTWVEINLDVAHQMGIRTGDIVRIANGSRFIEVPAVPYPGIHPGVLAMPMGQGHTAYGRNASVGSAGQNPLVIREPVGETHVQLTKVRSAVGGYHADQNTLVLVQDRPGGQEPDAVKELIHTTAQAWKKAKPVTGPPLSEGSIFNRQIGTQKPTAD